MTHNAQATIYPNCYITKLVTEEAIQYTGLKLSKNTWFPGLSDFRDQGQVMILIALLLRTLASKAAFDTEVWRQGALLEPFQDLRVRLIPNCSVARAFLKSLPAANSSASAWRPWRTYVDTVYGEPVAGKVSVADFNIFYGVALSWPPRLPDSLRCDGFSVYTTYLAAHRSTTPSVLIRRASERIVVPSFGFVEVYRSSHHLAPEGVGYGCWFYLSRGTGTWVYTGRTRVIARSQGHTELHSLKVSGSSDGIRSSASRGGYHCVILSSADSEPLYVGSVTAPRPRNILELRIGPEICAKALATSGLQLAAAPAALYALPAVDGTWALTAQRMGLDSVQLYPTNRAGHAELVIVQPSCMKQHEPLGRCAPPGVVFAGRDPSTRLDRPRLCECQEPRRASHTNELMRCTPAKQRRHTM